MDKFEFVNKFINCPKCYQTGLTFLDKTQDTKVICKCGNMIPFHEGVLVIEKNDNIVDNFSLEWNIHKFTQVDSKGYKCGYEGTIKNSNDAFFQKTMIEKSEIKDKVILDAGCGVGRFAQILQPAAKFIVCLDLSNAIFRCHDLLPHNNILCIKGNLLDLPVIKETFDTAYSIGVLHHTGDTYKAFAEVARTVKKNGVFAGWVYHKNPMNEIPLVSQLQKLISEIQPQVLYDICKLAPQFRDLFKKYKLPNYYISNSSNIDECILDTFDWWSCKYRTYHTNEEIIQLLKNLGFTNIKTGVFPVSFHGVKT